MTSFIIVDPRSASVRREEHLNLYAACLSVGLEVGATDFGPIRKDLSVAVGRWALVGDPATYYGIERHLLNGPAVLYATDETKTIVDVPIPTNLRLTWFGGVAGVEAAIAAGKIVRPTRTLEGVVTWAWDGRQMTVEEAVATARATTAAAMERKNT